MLDLRTSVRKEAVAFRSSLDELVKRVRAGAQSRVAVGAAMGNTGAHQATNVTGRVLAN